MNLHLKPPPSPVDSSAAQPSRRRLVAALTSLAAAAAWLPAFAAKAADPDAALIALGLEYDRLQAAEDAAYAHHDECCDAYAAAEPVPGDAMRYRTGDLALGLPVGPDCRCISDGPHSDLYTRDEIDLLSSAPPPWKGREIADQHRRVAEIRAEFDRWTAECEALHAATGLDASEAAIDAAMEARLAVAQQIAATSATTVAGLKVRARIVEQIYDGDLTGDWEGNIADRLMLWSIVRDLAAMTG